MSEKSERKCLTAYCSKQYDIKATNWKIRWSKKVEKALSKCPSHIRYKLFAWAKVVELLGLPEVRKRTGYHDEPLKGARNGQRSVRLNKSYRAIYIELIEGQLRIVDVIEVNKHAY